MKNKYREAFGDIVDNGVTLDYFNEKAILPQEDNPLFIIQELIDKETPMNPTQKGEDKYHCGKCGFIVADRVRNFSLTRCGNSDCGQKIDWDGMRR